MTIESQSVEAIRMATEGMGGRCPEYVFTIAGAARPGYMSDVRGDEYEWAMKVWRIKRPFVFFFVPNCCLITLPQ